MNRRIYSISRKEMKEIFSDPVFIALAFIVPLAVTFLFGYGLSLDVKNMPVVFLDQDSSPLSRDYIYSFTNSEYFRLAGLSKDMADLDSKMRSGRARVGIVIPPDFSRKLYKGHSTEV